MELAQIFRGLRIPSDNANNVNPDFFYALMVPLNHLSREPHDVGQFPPLVENFREETEKAVLELEENIRKTWGVLFDLTVMSSQTRLDYKFVRGETKIEYGIKLDDMWNLDLNQKEFDPIPEKCRVRNDKLYVSSFSMTAPKFDSEKLKTIFSYILTKNALQYHESLNPSKRVFSLQQDGKKEEPQIEVSGDDLLTRLHLSPELVAQYIAKDYGYKLGALRA